MTLHLKHVTIPLFKYLGMFAESCFYIQALTWSYSVRWKKFGLKSMWVKVVTCCVLKVQVRNPINPTVLTKAWF